MKVKDEINLLAKEYGKLKEPWVFVTGEGVGFTLGPFFSSLRQGQGR